MAPVYIKEKTFAKIHEPEHLIQVGEYEQCKFTHCNFANLDLSGYVFSECDFTDCNLSLVTLKKTALRVVSFTDSKLLGMHFENCNEFGLALRFTHCMMNTSSFFNMDIRSTTFTICELHDVDFSECNVSGSVFESCDLLGATFNRTNLEKADLRTAYNFSIDPDKNKIKKAKFSLNGTVGLLGKYDIEIE